jgi:hypothetical protein
VYYREYAPAFEIFARSESLQYFSKVAPLLGIKSKAELAEMLPLFGAQGTPIYLPGWDMFRSFSLKGALNFDKLVTKP